MDKPAKRGAGLAHHGAGFAVHENALAVPALIRAGGGQHEVQHSENATRALLYRMGEEARQLALGAFPHHSSVISALRFHRTEHLASSVDQKEKNLNIGMVALASAFFAGAVAVSYVYVDLSLNRLGVPASLIGLNAAMPAVGWLIATPLMPWALRRVPPRHLLSGLLAIAALALVAFPLTSDLTVWMVARFLFGGGCGMVFRLIEYWINAASPQDHRARNVGLYSSAFGAGAVLATGVFPLVGVEGWAPVLMILGLLAAGALVLRLCPGAPPPIDRLPRRPSPVVAGPAMIAFIGILVFGLFEAVPYTLFPVYAVRSGLTEDVAIWTVTAFLGGVVLFQVPIGMMADRLGKRAVLMACALIALAVSTVVPLAVTAPSGLLCLLVLWGGMAGAFYTISLALLADLFEGPELAGANAVFGTLYAAGSLVGAPVFGLSMDLWDPQGLMAAAFVLIAGYVGVLLLAPLRRRRIA